MSCICQANSLFGAKPETYVLPLRQNEPWRLRRFPGPLRENWVSLRLLIYCSPPPMVEHPSPGGGPMRVLIACSLLISAGLSLAQSSRDLRSRFGEPDVERYTATNDIGLTVEYGSDGLACQILIERKQPLLHSNRAQAQQYMSQIGRAHV